MRRFEARSVLVACALCTSLGMFLFVDTRNYPWMLVFRALNGLGQAGISTYTPVWISEFSPKRKQTIWMGYFVGC